METREKEVYRDEATLKSRISFLQNLLNEHYEPGVEPSTQLQRVIDELDRLVAIVMQRRLTARICSSGGSKGLA